MKTPSKLNHLMKGAFHNLSIKRKLLVIVITSLAIAMLSASIFFVLYDRGKAQENLANNIELIAIMTGKRSSAALAFNDKNALRDNLETLRILPGYIAACVYDREHKLYLHDNLKGREHLENHATPCPQTPNTEKPSIIEGSEIRAIAEITRNNVIYGSLLIRYSLEEIEQRTKLFSIATFIISMISILITLLITRRLQGSFIYPITSLNAIADLVSQSQDYAIRAPLHSHDEIGNLVKSFNGMLNIIQQKHLSLNEAILELQQSSLELKSYAASAEERGAEFQQLLAGASHDLRQPLQAMAIFVDALKLSATKDQSQLVKKLDIAIENMSQLFSDLLDYSRLRSKQQANFIEGPVNLKQLLFKVSHEFEAVANDKNLFVRFRADDINVIGHSTSIERIIRNLLSNAIRYTETGGVLISCRRRQGGVVVEVFDSGIGIKPESLSTIFDSYVQEDRNFSGQQDGVGLGLSIVTRLCNLMHYSLEVKSNLGRGTRFRIVIPAPKYISTSAADRSDDAPSVANLIDQTLMRQQVLEDKSVCLIDDDPEILAQLHALLTSWGAKVSSADSLEQVHQLIPRYKRSAPDIIVSDYQIGVVDTGIDAVDLIRVACNHAVPALIITGISDETELQILRSQGYNVLRKPVKPAKLRAVISFMLNQ
ncbi:ATP-binding protein [Simiduia curdlanivorans]|uniref:histidine kinase n=1 Tax=Simiduia curdlanivorans TaxID=1492769 RepID=A0ABV8V285_9GAMM|nr:ATP-binding protein [Simiduia curdlanivorans]MDN3637338.1 ATP-binding protein [Simiduia curdlanivorans]